MRIPVKAIRKDGKWLGKNWHMAARPTVLVMADRIERAALFVESEDIGWRTLDRAHAMHGGEIVDLWIVDKEPFAVEHPIDTMCRELVHLMAEEEDRLSAHQNAHLPPENPAHPGRSDEHESPQDKPESA